MASADSLVALFSAMTQNLQQDQAHLNRIDADDGDAGDNMVANFQLVTDTLAQAVRERGRDADTSAALRQAAEALRAHGQGATAPIYAQGLADAAQRLQGKSGFSIEDLLPLLEGMLSGTQQASGTQQGQGSLLDVLLPGIMAFMQAKQAGAADTEAILQALLSVRRGANSTAGVPRGYGRYGGQEPHGQIDPGAAGAASLLEGLFGALLSGALRQGSAGRSTTRRAPTPAPSTPPAGGLPGFPGLPGDLGDLIGGLFGGPPQQSAPTRRRRTTKRI